MVIVAASKSSTGDGVNGRGVGDLRSTIDTGKVLVVDEAHKVGRLLFAFLVVYWDCSSNSTSLKGLPSSIP